VYIDGARETSQLAQSAKTRTYLMTPRSTEGGEAPDWQGATTENTGQYLREEQRRQARGPRRAFRSALGWETGCIAGRMQPGS
jgi:hypothetical protein